MESTGGVTVNKNIIFCFIFVFLLAISANSKSAEPDRPELPKNKEFVIKLKITNEFEINTITKKITNKKYDVANLNVKIKYKPWRGYKLFAPDPDPLLLKLKEYYFKLVFETGGDPTTYIEIYKEKNVLLFNWIQPGKTITVYSGEAYIE